MAIMVQAILRGFVSLCDHLLPVGSKHAPMRRNVPAWTACTCLRMAVSCLANGGFEISIFQ
jgi:hypothetical protein